MYFINLISLVLLKKNSNIVCAQEVWISSFASPFLWVVRFCNIPLWLVIEDYDVVFISKKHKERGKIRDTVYLDCNSCSLNEASTVFQGERRNYILTPFFNKNKPQIDKQTSFSSRILKPLILFKNTKASEINLRFDSEGSSFNSLKDCI